MSPSNINKCPCGKTPENLIEIDNNQGGKWAVVSGDCCSEWSIEFRNLYYEIDSDGSNELALEAWNNAPRADVLSS